MQVQSLLFEPNRPTKMTSRGTSPSTSCVVLPALPCRKKRRWIWKCCWGPGSAWKLGFQVTSKTQYLSSLTDTKWYCLIIFFKMDLINQYVGPSQHHRQQPIGDGRWFIQPIFARISEMVSVLGWIPHYQVHKWMRSWGFLPAWWLGSYREGFVFPSLGLSFFFWEPCSWQICDVIAKKLHPLELFWMTPCPLSKNA